MANSSWPMNKNLPDRPRSPSMAGSASWQLQQWRVAMGGDMNRNPQRVWKPLMPMDEVGKLMIALKRKRLTSLDI